MTFEYTREERELSREIQKLQQDRSYHRRMMELKEKHIVESKRLLDDKLLARGVLKKSRTLV